MPNSSEHACNEQATPEVAAKNQAAAASELVAALTRELRVGIDAIAANDLSALTNSIYRQEELCAALAQSDRCAVPPRCDRGARPGHTTAPGSGDSYRNGNLLPDLLHTTLEYSLLISSGSRSIQLLSALRSGFAGDLCATPGSGMARDLRRGLPRTWHCEA